MTEKMERRSGERRKHHRLKVQIPVDVFYGARRHTLGEVVNLSRDGAAMDALHPLTIGQLYRFHLHGFGIWPGIVIRRFGATRHGIRFEADEGQKCRIDEVIRTILGGCRNRRRAEFGAPAPSVSAPPISGCRYPCHLTALMSLGVSSSAAEHRAEQSE